MRNRFLALALVLGGCRACGPAPTPAAEHQFTVANDTDAATTVYVAFGANSVVNAASWGVCGSDGGVDGGLNCSFQLPPNTAMPLPLGKQYLNATVAFGAPVGCGSTKAEININNPSWYDIVDVSLVDGYSNRIKLDVTSPALDGGASDGGTVSISPNGASGNSAVFGVFPLGCDICTARQNPPCGQSPGGSGCKAGTQYAPEPPCQYQGSVMGGGSVVRVALER